MKSKVSFRKEGLLTGILITYLAHAISVAENPIMSYEQSWDGFNYNVIIGHTRGTITFAQDTIVGAFRNERSERINEYPQTKAIDYFRDAPQLICDIAIADTLEYLYDKVDKTIMPVATTAFWSEGEELFSCDLEEEFYNQGGEFIRNLVLPEGQLYDEIEDEYELNEAAFQSLKYLIGQKSNSLFKPISISTQELAQIIGENPEGMSECLKALAGIYISVSQ